MSRFKAFNKSILAFRLLALSCLTLTLSSCATYSTGFNCSGGRGANCVMLSEVDRRVTSGEIETVYFAVIEKKLGAISGSNLDVL